MRKEKAPQALPVGLLVIFLSFLIVLNLSIQASLAQFLSRYPILEP